MADSKTVAVAVAGGKDCFQDLPEPVLELLLTSVLARRWRILWKSVPSLRFDASQFESAQALNDFASKLLEHRDRTVPLRECHIISYQDGAEDEALCDLESWVQYAFSCQVSVLRIESLGPRRSDFLLSSNSVISKYLTVLDLFRLEFGGNPLDLFFCQALQVLEIDHCSVNLGDVLPKSLRHLKIRSSRLFSRHKPQSGLSALGLVTFELADPQGWTPLLENLPSLVKSFIRLSCFCEDACDNVKCLGDCGDESCHGCYGEDGRCVLLKGLSGTTNLELISQYSMIFRKDLRWRPMFSKLRTLVLNEWCLTGNFSGLLHFLQHSPILEKLTLQLPSRKGYHFDIGSSGSYNPAEYFLVSKHLKVVEIHCSKEDEWICEIVNILGSHGVTSAQISIKHDSWSSCRFSFEQPK
ncbi:hypothetical protein VPH35_049125 [Triticum aestivum]